MAQSTSMYFSTILWLAAQKWLSAIVELARKEQENLMEKLLLEQFINISTKEFDSLFSYFTHFDFALRFLRNPFSFDQKYVWMLHILFAHEI